jgi:hypothetical protein
VTSADPTRSRPAGEPVELAGPGALGVVESQPRRYSAFVGVGVSKGKNNPWAEIGCLAEELRGGTTGPGGVPGSGKSEALRRHVAEKLRAGRELAVVDAKAESLRWSPDLGDGVADTAVMDEPEASSGLVGVEAQCEDCALVFLVEGVEALSDGVEVRCGECGGVLVEVVSELLVDGSAGVLLDPVLPLDPHAIAELVDGGDAEAVA